MWHHHVLFKMKPEKRGELDTFVAKLKQLKSDVPEIRELRVHLNQKKGRKSFDVYYYVSFDDAAGFEAYMKNPKHVPVIAYVDEVCSDVGDVDYAD